MEKILLIIIMLLVLMVTFLIIRQVSYHKRILQMKEVISEILEGKQKLQIFSHKEDDLGQLAFEINRLTLLFGTTQERYEKEQISKKQLLSNLSHDVRTPLVSVIGYLEAIVQRRIEKKQEEEYIATAYKKALLLKEQVNQLFEFVQSDANEIELTMEKVDVCELTRQILIDFVPILESEKIELNSSIPDSEVFICADRDGLTHIIQNIIKNTLTHAQEGKYLGIFIGQDTDKVNIDIADKGYGIDDEHLPFIFDRLYKADNARTRGGGIGLAIAKELSNKMKGNIEVLRSKPGDTVFRITFTRVE